MGFFKCIKKLFGAKKKGFVTPQDFSHSNGVSTRPRSPIMKTTPEILPVPVPSVYLTGPSLRRRTTVYRVHSYGGPSAPAPSVRNSVRFSHPVVNAQLLRSSNASANSENVGRFRSNSANTDVSGISSDASDCGLIQPKKIWRFSSQSATDETVRETYEDFKQRLDGHAARSNRASDRPPSLQCIARLSSMRLFGDDAETKTSYSTPADEAANVEKHRSNALSTLEGQNSRFVLAILPRKDLPITAVQLSSEHLPGALVPGGQTRAKPNQRPHTFCAPSTGPNYQAYAPYSDADAAASTPQVNITKTPMTILELAEIADEDISKRHTQHYRNVESGIFEPVSANTAASTPRVDLPKPPKKMPELPDIADEEVNNRHSQHYKNVESGSFEYAVAPKPTLVVPTPRPTWESKKGNNAFLLPPSPPPSPPTPPKPTQASNRKPVPAPNFSKPLPPAPAEARKDFTPASSSPGGRIPTPFNMNDNRYPFVFAKAGKNFSAEPKYQRRSNDPEETKFKKAQATKKPEKKNGKQVVREQDVQKRAELNALDAQLKHMMGC